MANKKYAYKIISELNLIVRYFTGEINLTDILQSMTTVADEKNYLSSMDIINDIRDVELKVKHDEIQQLIDFVRSNKKIYYKRTSYILTNTPGQVVFGRLIDLFKKEDKINVVVVSTLETIFFKLDMIDTHKVIVNDALNLLKAEINI